MELVLSDEELIRQYLGSRTTACFNALYNRYVRKVYNRCLSIVKDVEKAKDFTHDIFIRIFSRLEHFQERSTFATWLYAISYNYCMDQIRLSNRLATTSISNELDYEYTAGSDNTEEVEYSLQQLSHAMKAIPPQEAMILKLKYQEGLGVHEIAQQLNIKESAVKMRLKRSRSKVKQLCELASVE